MLMFRRRNKKDHYLWTKISLKVERYVSSICKHFIFEPFQISDGAKIVLSSKMV